MQNATLNHLFDLSGLLERARVSSRVLARADRDGALLEIAEVLPERQTDILNANAEDVASERGEGTSTALLDRLVARISRRWGRLPGNVKS